MTSGDPGGSLLPPPSFGRDLTHGDDARHLEVFDRYERRTYELDRLIDQLFLYGCSARNVERVSKDLWGKKVGRSTVSRVSETFEDEGKAINEAPVPGEIRAICTSTARPTRCPPSWGS